MKWDHAPAASGGDSLAVNQVPAVDQLVVHNEVVKQSPLAGSGQKPHIDLASCSGVDGPSILCAQTQTAHKAPARENARQHRVTARSGVPSRTVATIEGTTG